MAMNKVEICGVDTSTLPVISNERMRELFPLVHSGDLNAREEFIRGNLRLVLSVIQRFSNRGENVDDLFQVGCIGLIKALDNFDVTQNVRFSTYAVPMIIGEIRRYLRDNNAIRVSRSLRDIAYKALKARDRLAERMGREPNVTELAEELKLPRQHMVRQIPDGQRRELAEHRRDGQNQQNQKEAGLLFPGQQGEDAFPDFPAVFGLLHNAHDPFHVAQAMVARIILPHIGDRENGRVRS